MDTKIITTTPDKNTHIAMRLHVGPWSIHYRNSLFSTGLVRNQNKVEKATKGYSFHHRHHHLSLLNFLTKDQRKGFWNFFILN